MKECFVEKKSKSNFNQEKFPDSVLSIEDLTIVRGLKTVLSNFNHTFICKKLYLLEGNNGVGKSSLLRTISGLINPFSGLIKWNGLSINKTKKEFVNKINYIGHSNGLSPILSVKKNLEYWLSISGNNGNLNNALNTFEIKKFSLTPVIELSSGLQRRVALSRLLLCRKNIWLLDEPLNSIDEENQKIFFEQILNHINNNGIVIMATHQKVKNIPFKNIKTINLNLRNK